MDILKTLCKLLLLVFLLAAASLYLLFAPNYTPQLHHQGQIINITRNQYGIPFISAQSRRGFLYGHGWVLAEDRAFQIAFRRLVTDGRLAEYVGQLALPMDKFMREVDLGGWGERMGERLKRQNISQYQLLQAMADGVNECMGSRTLPLDFRLISMPWQNWTVSDIFKIYKLLEFSQSVSAFDQIYRSALLATHTKEQIDTIFPSTQQDWAFDSKVVIADAYIPERLKTANMKRETVRIKPELIENLKQIQNLDLLRSAEGSNSWIIAGKYTESGEPILASDPHMSNSIPSNFYQFEGCYWKDGRKLCASAFSVPGSIVFPGKFNYVAAAATTIYADTIDFFKEKVQNNKYLVDGQWRQLTTRNQIIKIKTGNGTKQLEYLIKQTHRGPIINYYISDLGNFQIPQDISFQWTGANDDYTANLLGSYIIEAEDFQYLKQSTTGVKLLNFNLVFITADGHIMNQRYGWYPIRKNPEMGNYIKDGTTTEDDWQGYIPLEDRLTTIDPECGYIVAANNRGSTDLYYDGLHTYHAYTARADRITEMIEDYISRGVKINTEITKRMLTDTVDSYCRRILPIIIKVLPQSASILNNFDCDFTEHSVTAPVYELFYSELHHLIKKTKFEQLSVLSLHNNYQYLYNFIKKAHDNPKNIEILQQAWRRLLKNPQLSFNGEGKQTRRWGQIHKDIMNHAPFGKNKILSYFYNRQFEGRGNMHTVNVGKMPKSTFGNYAVGHRAGNRAIFTYGGPSYWVLDSGASELFYSKHYDDQWKLFKQNIFLEIRQHQIEANGQSQL